MVFYLNYLSNEGEYEDLNISLSKKLTKCNREFMKFVLDIYSKNKETYIEVEKNELFRLLNIEDTEELKNYLDKFMRMKVYYSFKDINNHLFQGAFQILDSYFIQNNNVVIVLSREITLSFVENNFFSKVNLKGILDFQFHNTLPLYLRILNIAKNNMEGKINITIEELKEFLELNNSYDRFYDFEKKVISPIIEDLNTYSEYEISVEKVKKGDYKSAKVIGIEIKYINKKIRKWKEESNYLISIVKDKIKDFEYVYSTIYEYIRLFGYDYVYSNIMYVYKNNEKNIDDILRESLKLNIAANKKSKLDKVIIEKVVSTPFKLHDEITKALLKLDLGHLIEDHLLIASFIKNIYTLKCGEKYSFQNDWIRLEVIFNKESKSSVEIVRLKK